MELILIAIAGYAFYQYNEFQKFQKSVSVRVTKIGFDFNRSLNDGFKNVFVNVTITVGNSTGFNQTFNGFELIAEHNGRQVGALRSDSVLTLKTGENVYTVPLALNTLNVFKSVQDAITALKSKTGIVVNISGSFRIGSYNLPINETLKVA